MLAKSRKEGDEESPLFAKFKYFCDQNEAEKKQAALSAQQAKKQKSKEGFLSFLNNGGSAEDQEAGISFSLGNILTLNLFTNEKDDKQQIMRLADSLDSINKRLDHIER